ncbi:hypothetical protein JHJ32_17360 [Parapedobacter sp. ISTM3]|uniref:hypothetical protein n=1 Tax=Parapedobacter sp. ISTM3 TaxID=2800130 RepID=UPI0019078055|nr:hypothetical protein [Parapedobacter sp. ISTM3]MBK1441771.1 hypothetical protein [Parapedobacter sp. ISTM3]
MKTKKYNNRYISIVVLFAIMPGVTFSQKSKEKEATLVKQDTLPAINLDSEVYQRILSTKHNSRSQEESTFVLYNDKLYPIADFHLQQNEKKSNTKSIKIINHPDSIKTILSNRIKSIIVIEDKGDSDN